MTARFTPISCEEFAVSVADLLERDLDEASRAAVEAHALDCEACAALLSDLRKISIDASNLPMLAPSRDLWEGIAARIDAPVIPIGARTEGRRIAGFGGRDRKVLRTAAIAASLLLAAGVGGLITFGLMRNNQPLSIANGATPAAPKSAAAPSNVQPTIPSIDSVTRVVARQDASPASESGATVSPVSESFTAAGGAHARNKSAEQTFDVEIARLRTIVQRRSAQLDPLTISVIERNLKVIDDAIAQCRAALAKDPASRFLIESLNHALENKVELLRTAAMLPART